MDENIYRRQSAFLSKTPEVGNEIYVIAVRSLHKRQPPFQISPVLLGKYFNLLQLPARTLVQAGLISITELDRFLQCSESRDDVKIPIALAIDEYDLSTPFAKQVDDFEFVEIPSSVIPSHHSDQGPIGSVMHKNGIEISASELGRLMHLLSTPPMFFVRQGLISEAFLTSHAPGTRNEIYFYREYERGHHSHESHPHDSRGLGLLHSNHGHHHDVHSHTHDHHHSGHQGHHHDHHHSNLGDHIPKIGPPHLRHHGPHGGHSHGHHDAPMEPPHWRHHGPHGGHHGPHGGGPGSFH